MPSKSLNGNNYATLIRIIRDENKGKTINYNSLLIIIFEDFIELSKYSAQQDWPYPIPCIFCGKWLNIY